ncbi:hypothetical protein PG994_013670 [Apiospora phragmitis]|uniref:N-acetyltransferase domain-containing protein n=1 Tax=Apiospora phragmitis TaxID=2905665 RepID=A0ABR1T9A7_9PEZI
MIRDCDFDGMLFSLGLGYRKKGIGHAFFKALKKHLGEGEAKTIYAAYGVSIPATPEGAGHNDDDDDDDDEGAYMAVLRFCQGIVFRAGTDVLTEAWAAAAPTESSVYKFRFREPNPWKEKRPTSGSGFGVVRNYNMHMSEPQIEVAQAFGRDMIRFVHGQKPWEPTVCGFGGSRLIFSAPVWMSRSRLTLNLNC